jgi:hypothetical protein
MQLTDIFIRRPVLASVVSLLILVLGLRALGTLQVLQYPQTQNAIVTINTIYFIADLDRAFAELTRVIATSGRAVVGIGDPRMMASIPTTRFGFTIRQVDEIATMAKSAGLILQDHKRAGRGEQAAHLLVFMHGSSA